MWNISKRQILSDPARAFLVVGSLFGLFFVFLFPPFQIIDEQTHFFKAYAIAEGSLIGHRNTSGNVGDDLPVSLSVGAAPYGRLIFRYDQKQSPRQTLRDVSLPLNPAQMNFVPFRNTIIYPPLTYLPQIIAIKITMFFKTSPIFSLYAARLAALSFWLLLTYWAIKLLPYGKWTLFVLALFPMSLSQAASVSADSVINAVSFFAIALILYATAYKKTLSKSILWLLFASGVVLALIKMPYFLVMLAAIAIPSNNFPARFNKRRFLAVTYIVMSVLIVGWTLLVKGMHQDLRPPDTSVSAQAQVLLRHPDVFVKGLLEYPFTKDAGITLSSFYGLLGWNEIKIPIIVIAYGYGLLILSLFEKPKLVITKAVRCLSAGTWTVTVMAILVLLYLSWIPVGTSRLYDVWGRYFSSIALLLVPLVAGTLRFDEESYRKIRTLIVVSTLLMLALATFLIWNRYYFHFPLG